MWSMERLAVSKKDRKFVFKQQFVRDTCAAGARAAV